MTTGLWLSPQPLVLASGSATRRELLAGAGIAVVVHPAAIDERAVESPLSAAGAPADAIAAHLARAKAVTVSTRLPGRLVLGADQTLACGARLFTKPVSRAAARAQLLDLAARIHHLHSAWALALDGAVVAEGQGTAHLTMRRLSDAFLDRYLALEGDAVRTSVGGYRLEGLGIHLFETVEGDHATILGLPLLSLLPALRQLGYLLG